MCGGREWGGGGGGGGGGRREGGREGGKREREGVHVLCYNHVNSRYVSEEGWGGGGEYVCIVYRQKMSAAS